MPAVSVVMTVHGDLRFLDAAVDSVLGQTLADLELVIVDDGTGDRVMFSRVAEQDRRIRIVTLPENVGTYAAVPQICLQCRRWVRPFASPWGRSRSLVADPRDQPRRQPP
jgi:hypothetical protein